DEVAVAPGCASYAPFACVLEAGALADGRAHARADVPFARFRLGRGFARGVRLVGARPRGSVADDQVEERGRRDDGNDPRRGAVSDPALLEVAHHAVRRAEPERGATRQQDGIDLVDAA